MVFFIDSTGRSYTLLANSLPSARGQGEPLTGRLVPPIGAEFIDVVMGEDEQVVVVSSDAGYGFVTSLGNLKSKTKSGKHLITLSGHAKTMKLVMVDDFENELAVVTNRGRLLIFPVSELPQLSKGKGNKLIQITKPSSIEQIEIISDLCILNDVQKLKIYFGSQKIIFKPEDWINFVSHRARKGKDLRPSYVTNVDYMEAVG